MVVRKRLGVGHVDNGGIGGTKLSSPKIVAAMTVRWLRAREAEESMSGEVVMAVVAAIVSKGWWLLSGGRGPRMRECMRDAF